MHPSIHAQAHPHRPAYIMAESGLAVSYAALDAQSNRIAQYFRRRGLRRGDHVAIMMQNRAGYFEVAWGAQRAGLYLTAISTRLGVDEVAYILSDADVRILISCPALADTAQSAAGAAGEVDVLVFDAERDDAGSFHREIAGEPPTPIADESPGGLMLYSSGTTGRPKGIVHPLPEGPIAHATLVTDQLQSVYGMDENSVYLTPAPLYHSAPLAFSMSTQRLGGTTIVMEQFDAEAVLSAIERYRVTHAQFVPTHFVRMLKLPKHRREGYDLASLQLVMHAAAPCPVPIKQQMLDWWGPIIHEYYGGTESIGGTYISPSEWLMGPGSVGRVLPPWTIHICDAAGDPLPAGEEGSCTSPVAVTSSITTTWKRRRRRPTPVDGGRWEALGGLMTTDIFTRPTARIL